MRRTPHQTHQTQSPRIYVPPRRDLSQSPAFHKGIFAGVSLTAQE